MAKLIGILTVIYLYAACIYAVPLENEINEVPNEILLKGISKCAEAGGLTGIVNCAAVRTLKSLQLATKKPVIEIIPGITLNSENPDAQRSAKELKENELPVDPQERAERLYDLLLDNTSKMISGRTLKVKLPEDVSDSMSRALDEGKRRKRRKGGMFPQFMLGIGAKMLGIVPAAIAGLGLLATKALIVAKLALVLSVIVFFQYFGGRGGSILGSLGGHGGGGYGHGTGYGASYGGGGSYGSYSPPTWTTNSIGGGNYPYARSIDVADEANSAQELAYSRSKKE